MVENSESPESRAVSFIKSLEKFVVGGGANRRDNKAVPISFLANKKKRKKEKKRKKRYYRADQKAQTPSTLIKSLPGNRS